MGMPHGHGELTVEALPHWPALRARSAVWAELS
jgi:hypothetical protein